MEHLTEYCIDYFQSLKDKYGAKYPRRTKITSFENIEATKVVASNAKLYINRSEGFIGTSPKKIEEAEYVSDCSDIDEVIVFIKDGRYTLRKVTDKQFVEKGIIHAAVFKRGDTRTIYNAVYRDGKGGTMYAKRFAVTGIIRDRWYDLTKGTPGSQVYWLTANPNGEAETVPSGSEASDYRLRFLAAGHQGTRFDGQYRYEVPRAEDSAQGCRRFDYRRQADVV